MIMLEKHLYVRHLANILKIEKPVFVKKTDYGIKYYFQQLENTARFPPWEHLWSQ